MTFTFSKLKTYDVLLIPTGETSFGEHSFPVTNEAIKMFKGGRYGCIFVTGGYSGFATKERRDKDSEGKETYDYILGRGIKGINSDNVYYDDQSLDSVTNFTFPIVKPMINPYTKKENPNFNEFDNMQIFAKEGHMWRLEDYANLVFPGKFGEEDFFSVPGEHNNGLMAKVYHRGIMKAANNYLEKNKDDAASRPEKVHNFLREEHPFYSGGWYEKSVLERKALMAGIGGLWNMGFKARLK